MPEIEYLTVANHAEAINGLLYLQGAGWTTIQQPMTAQDTPGIFSFGIALSILIGREETNRRFPVTLRLLGPDDANLPVLNVQVQAGHLPTLPPSQLRNVLALNAQAQFSAAGDYVLRAEIGTDDGPVSREVSFRVIRPTPA